MKRRIIKINHSWHRLIMFDFDDTLARTEECTVVRDIQTDRIVNHLRGQSDFDNYTLNEDKHYFDYEEFLQVSDFAEPIEITIGIMKKFIEDPKNKVIVLTARQPQSVSAIRHFLEKQEIDTDKVSIFGSSGSRNKADYLSRLIERFHIKDGVLVFEDNLLNISDMIPLEYKYPDLAFNFVQVIDPENTEEDLEEAKKFEYPKGEYGTEKYQRILKKIHPAMKRRLIGLGGNDYLDKGKKKVRDFKRTKSAPPGV